MDVLSINTDFLVHDLGRLSTQNEFGLEVTLEGFWVLKRSRTERFLRTGIESILSSFLQVKKGAAKLARQTPATWRRTPRSSTTSGSSCRSSTPPSTAWAPSTTCPPWPEPGPVRRRTSWPPGTRLTTYCPPTSSAPSQSPGDALYRFYQAWVGTWRAFQCL